MSHEIVNGAEFEQLLSGHGDSEVCEQSVCEAEKPLLRSEQSDVVVKKETSENEPPEADVGDTAHKSASHLTSTAETNHSYAKNIDLKELLGMVCMKLQRRREEFKSGTPE